jgi:hypothetical protein
MKSSSPGQQQKVTALPLCIIIFRVRLDHLGGQGLSNPEMQIAPDCCNAQH